MIFDVMMLNEITVPKTLSVSVSQFEKTIKIMRIKRSKLTTVQQIKSSFYLLNFPSLQREGSGGELRNKYQSAYLILVNFFG